MNQKHFNIWLRKNGYINSFKSMKFVFSFFLLFFFSTFTFAQSIGDYRSSTSGAWTTLSSWEYYNGSAWVTPSGTNPQGYPGQFTTGNVLIQAGHSISIDSAGISTQPITSLTISGNLQLNGINTGGSGTDYFFNTPYVYVTPNVGTITFDRKVNFKLPANAVLQVTSNPPTYYGLVGDCNNNQDIVIGTTVFAYCNGGGSTALNFDEVMSGGGSLNAVPNSNTPICAGNSINLLGSITGNIGSNLTYSWSVTPPSGPVTNYSTQNVTIANALAGTYTVTLTCSTTYSSVNYSNFEIISISVTPKPSVISVGTIMQPTCSVVTGSVVLSNLPSSGNWIINPGNISGSGTSTTLNGLAIGTYNFTVTNASGCVSNPSVNVVIQSANLTWNGSVNNNWFNSLNWTPNVIPASNACVTIPNTANQPSVTGATVAYCNTLTILSGGNLNISAGSVIEVTDVINVNAGGVFNLSNSANLIQINNVANIGNITSSRTTSVRRQDYVYWSSPVANFPVTSVSPGSSLIYKWLPTTATGYTSNFGNWTSANENMTLGKGYIIRGPNSYSLTVPANFTANFIGVPNNGNISMPISRSTYNGVNYTGPSTSTQVTANDDNWNLVGNPYPSSINAISFLTANSNIAGFVNLWTHGTLPVSSTSPFYANYTYNYSAADYITYNSSGASTGPIAFNGFIGSGQGFFVLMNHSSVGTTENILFNNSMRNRTYNNSQFFRASNSNANSEQNIERNRVWLDIIKSSDNSNTRTLIGYIEGATDGLDRLYDATGDENLNFNIYSVIDDELQIIQGKSLPFNELDKVNISFKVPQNGEYRIAIGALDGLFENQQQSIFLEDRLLNITHDLRLSPYSFNANIGRDDNRFVLKYLNESLTNDDFLYADTIKIFVNNNLTVESSNLSIKQVFIYDINGKKIIESNNINRNQFTLTQLKLTTSVILVKVILENGVVVTKKVIY